MGHAFGGASLDLEAVETAARSSALAVAARVVEAALNQNTKDYRGGSIACSCGGSAVYAGRRTKQVLTILGKMTISRAYYYDAACGHGVCPRDEELGIGNGSCSPGMMRMISSAAAEVSFATAAELIDELSGVGVSVKRVERTAKALGREIFHDEQQTVIPEAPSAPRLYVGIDGTGIPMRPQELAGRAGKQEDGSAKTREVKLALVWSAQSRDDHGNPMRDPGSVTYSAAIERAAQGDCDDIPSAFALRVQREAVRRGVDQAASTAVVGDGAKWIWNLADEYFPGSLQIIDLYHAKGTIATAARGIYPASPEMAGQWGKLRRDELEAGQLDEVIASFQRHAETCEEAKGCMKYLVNNRERLQYPTFAEAGYSTSSGVVEAGCKLAIGTRLKRAGMHWSVKGANAIIALRCCKLSGRFEDFWERRSG